MEELNGILHGLPLLATILLVAMLAVLVAMGSDLCFGWRKAKMRGEARTSYAFSRSFSKFLLYMGMMIVSGCIDMLIHFVMYMFNVYYYVPVVAIGIAIVLCVTEIWSMKEKADEKTRNSIKSHYPNVPVYVHFYSPRWICRVGNYRTYEEAHQMLVSLRNLGFDQATIVKGKITVRE